MELLHRRNWIKNTGLALAGIGLGAPQFAFSREMNDEKKTLVRLGGNENPYGPSPAARKAMAKAIEWSNRYSWEQTNTLRELIASTHQLTSDQVLIGAGSSEILGLIAQLAAAQKGEAITADPSFQIWTTAAASFGLEIKRVPLTENKALNLDKMLDAITGTTRLFYICNPNNPTGTILPADTIRKAALEAAKTSLVIIDEAYLEYTDEPSQINLVVNPNIIVVKTFSKIYGLAGARVGYAIAHRDTIKKLVALQPWANAGASAVSVAAAIACYIDTGFLQHCRERNAEAREYTSDFLKEAGLRVIPSNTNFIYYSLGNYNGNWTEGLRSKGIVSGRIVEATGNWTRTSIGTLEEMKQFTKAAKSLLSIK